MKEQSLSGGAATSHELYSEAVVSGGLVFCSGTLGIDPATGEATESAAAQTEQALRNLANVLSGSGSAMQHLVKTTIYYAESANLAEINEVYARHMPTPPPARSAVPCLALPAGQLFCIDGIATLS